MLTGNDEHEHTRTTFEQAETEFQSLHPQMRIQDGNVNIWLVSDNGNGVRSVEI